jgi:hypothetical protein
MKTLIATVLLALVSCTGDDHDSGLTNGAAGTIQFSVSGESLALGGYAFPPAGSDDPAFVDGWDIRFDKLIAVVDHISLAETPDENPADESQFGKKVAEVDGPWAIDLHQGGPLAGKGGGDEQAYPLAQVANQNLNGNRPFDDTQRYAFSFDTVPATADATKLFIADDDPDYADMVANGWSVLYVGTATFKGTTCTTSDDSFDFTQLPTTVHFRLGFASPTSYLNCQNPDNDPAQALGDEEHERGVQVKTNGTTIAQVTIHTDHPFWESFVHDSPARFDELAAIAKADNGAFNVTLNDAVGVDYHAFTFGAQPLPWRSCITGQTWPGDDPQMGFDDLGTTVADLSAYMTYNQSTQGHLNSDGLCFVQRNYQSAR